MEVRIEEKTLLTLLALGFRLYYQDPDEEDKISLTEINVLRERVPEDVSLYLFTDKGPN